MLLRQLLPDGIPLPSSEFPEPQAIRESPQSGFLDISRLVADPDDLMPGAVQKFVQPAFILAPFAARDCSGIQNPGVRSQKEYPRKTAGRRSASATATFDLP
jgi:hypothetical protein